MSALIAELAKTIVTLLNGAAPGTFSQSFTAERRYLPQSELEDLQSVKVTVISAARTSTRGA